VVGCNQAFRLGPKVCDYIVFCDKKLIRDQQGRPRPGFYDALEAFPNPVITTDPFFLSHRAGTPPWLKVMARKPHGLHRDALGYNFNTGITALNLALLLGATTVYLLGFDMQLGRDGQPNWHNHLIDKPDAMVYNRMIKAMDWVRLDLPDQFPGCQVFNVTRGSRLPYIPQVDFDEFWARRSAPDMIKT
jgi:hypothetical protein